MSAFLSNKLLAMRSLTGPRRIVDHDLPCAGCGYNLRGLPVGRACPECGQPMKAASLNDPLLVGDMAFRGRTAFGLLLITSTLLVLAVEAFAFMITAAFLAIPWWVHFALLMSLALAWGIGVWLITAREIDARASKTRGLALVTRLTQALWFIAHVLLLLPQIGQPGLLPSSTASAGGLICVFVAWIGSIFCMAYMLRLARGAELDDAARRLNLCLFFLPPVTLVVGILPFGPFCGLFLFLIAAIGWVALLWQWSRATWEMQRHVSWSRRLTVDRLDRTRRVQEVRREMEQEAASHVRPVAPPAGDDIPLEPP